MMKNELDFDALLWANSESNNMLLIPRWLNMNRLVDAKKDRGGCSKVMKVVYQENRVFFSLEEYDASSFDVQFERGISATLRSQR